MAWQTPKTDWGQPDGVRDADFNRIEGNTQYLYDTANVLRQAVDNALFAASQRVNLGDLADGAVFALYENDVLVPYIKLSNDYEGTGRALVVRMNSYTAGSIQEGSISQYAGSKVDVFLNNEFINALDTATRAVLTETTIDTYNALAATTISRKIFLLSRTEYNFSGGQVEGAVNYYFINPDRRIAMYDGFQYEHWTRTVMVSQEEAVYVTNTGALGTANPIVFTAGIRPAFTLPTTFEVIAGMPSTANVLATAEVI